jgi:SAM-dependent methyltransferase
MTDVLWHDIECGGYDLDLPLWRELAGREGSPVLDVGAGTGRVALDLARRGHEVVAPRPQRGALEALRERAGGPRDHHRRGRRARLRHRSPLPDRRGADADAAAPRRRGGRARCLAAHAST